MSSQVANARGRQEKGERREASSSARRTPIVLAGLIAVIAATVAVAPAMSQTEGDQAAPPAAPAEPAEPKAARPKAAHPRRSKPKPELKKPEPKKVDAKKAEAKKAEEKPATPPPPPAAPPTLAAAAAAGAEAAPLDIAAKLRQAGAGTCGATIDADAVSSMIGVTQSNTVTTWSDVEPHDKHAVSVFIAQRYGASPTVPYGVTGIIASPNASGSCDSTVVQVVTSPLPCANVRETLLRQGKPEGDLVGVQLIRSGQDQTLLMPTATNTCVLIGFRATFRR